MKDTSETTEFFCPGPDLTIRDCIANGQITALHHLARYRWASEVLEGLSSGPVLDIACGAGYGSYMMAMFNPSLSFFGVDYDARAIEIARSRYTAGNLSFHVGDIVTWCDADGKALGKFGCVVSLETIENLLHREIALINVAENLQPTGTLILSTPSGHKQPVLNPSREHHKIEYSGAYLFNLVSRYFAEVSYPENRSLPYMDFWDELNRDRQVYFNRMSPLVCRKPIQFGLEM